MDYFNYKSGQLFAEDMPVKTLAERYGTPLYVYSKATLERHYRVFDEALGDHPHKICYAVKANSNLGVLSVLANLGAGFDIVSGGELERVLAAGGDPKKIVFSGVGKLDWEIRRALEVGIYCFNAESWPELERINAIAGEMGKTPDVALRVNPDVDAKTHPYIATGLKDSKFGIDMAISLEMYEKASKLPHLRLRGVDCHIGSQLTELEPLMAAFDRVYGLVQTLKSKGFDIRHLDLGGGLGVPYLGELPPSPKEYATAIHDRFSDPDLELILEPGRAIAANAGILVTKVEYLKEAEHKNFAVVDAAMNDFARPSLYNAVQNIVPVVPREGRFRHYDIVGPVCESSDFLGKDRDLTIEAGDYLVIRSAGAYGFTMSSNYNTRPRAAEIMVDGDHVQVVRKRETVRELYVHENVIESERDNVEWDGTFTKMHSLGNDFVLIDGVRQKFNPTPALIKAMADRNTGVGFDQLLLVEKNKLKSLPIEEIGAGKINSPLPLGERSAPDEIRSRVRGNKKAVYRYRIFNADGTEVSQCGNGARCLAYFLKNSGLMPEDEIMVQTNAGEMILKVLPDNKAAVSLGIPIFEPKAIPLNAKQSKTYPLAYNGSTYEFSALSVGNPHAVIVVDSIDTASIQELGEFCQTHEYFPERVNVGFLEVVNKNAIKLRVYERGVGETQACGSGACAAVIAGQQQGLLGESVAVTMPGGQLTVEWAGEGTPVWLIGDVSQAFHGRVDYSLCEFY